MALRIPRTCRAAGPQAQPARKATQAFPYAEAGWVRPQGVAAYVIYAPEPSERGGGVGLQQGMIELPSYTAPPGHRWGTGATSVLRYLMKDLAQKPYIRAGTPAPSAARPQAGRPSR